MSQLLFAVFMAICATAQTARMPLPYHFEESAAYRWMHKPVMESRLLADMESLTGWSTKGKCEMTLGTGHVKDGTHSLRLRTTSRTPGDVLGASQRNFGYTGVYRSFAGEDWTKFNRISFWLYPNLPGWRVVNLRLVLTNEGKERLPDVYDNDGNNSLIGLINHQWNYVVWEIPSLPRDKITSLGFVCRRQGNEPEASDTLTFDIDHLTLDRVQADYDEGWKVAPGKIAFSHTGYRSGSNKTAVASGLAARRFELIDQDTGAVVLDKPVQTPGEFQVMDFSEVTRPGRYAIRAGNQQTPAFPVGDGVWRETITKVINFFYTERCGWDVPGSHRICHRDWMAGHDGRNMQINGGWHDAGDLSQGLVNTAEAVYSMLRLAEVCRQRGDQDLARQLIEEARWGLDWVHKTSFGDGYRVTWSTMGLWTDGVRGDNDDITARAVNSPFENYLAAAAEALAYRVLRESDPELAAYSLKMARQDWKAGEGNGGAEPIVVAASGIVASLDLWEATGEKQYADRALELSPVILTSQEHGYQGRKVPITGYFYTDPGKTAVFRSFHRGHDQAPVVALARLCKAFPNDSHWMEWYSAATLYSEYYLKAMARYTEPYSVLPSSIFREDEYLRQPESRREAFRRQVLNGVPLGNGYYLRRFPVWFDFRGHYGTVLSETKALSAAARLRQDPELERLAELQLQWVVGRNPFAMSTMFGEGHDYPPLYSAMSGNLVGALPVGIETRGNNDAPYWPNSNYPNWKEVWVHPASRWLWILADLLAAPPQDPPSIRLTQEPASDGGVQIRLEARGEGRHRFVLRPWNLDVTAPDREVDLKPGVTVSIIWKARPATAGSPWVALAIEDGDVSRRREVTGITGVHGSARHSIPGHSRERVERHGMVATLN